MEIRSIFEKGIGREIETVIKADDTTHIGQEVNEYVITQELSRKLEIFFAAYKEALTGRGEAQKAVANGVWISGFFGSGKSHLLKILSYVLENRTYDGQQIGQVFAAKANDNALLRADILHATRIPSQSILFNIDQKADITSKQQPDAILSVFYKVFNDFMGYYGAQGHVADFERALDRQGHYEPFRQAIKELTGSEWADIRLDYMWEEESIAQALARVKGNRPDDNRNVLEIYARDYKLSVEDFCERVREYIDRQQPQNFRLNFFVDEIGQYIADNSKLMLNLQTIAESLATRTKGRSWIFVTSQEDMVKVIGDMNARQENDFSRIQARFITRLSLTSANVDEVIQKRLLEKNAEGKAALVNRFSTDQHNFQTVFQFADGRSYKGYQGEADFVYKYPFLPYQFDLFQSCIRGLSLHNAFQGKHASVGERSMLGVFQLVVQKMADEPLGQFVTFNRLFDGISSTVRGEIQASITQANRNLENEMAKKVLQALFMVKYVKEFKATLRNIAILMTGDMQSDLKAHERAVLEALNILENQTYIQRNGDLYEYLTDEEKDIENEIKGERLEETAEGRLLSELLFDEIIRDPKIKYLLNKQDYDYTRKIDGVSQGRERELGINILTPKFENYENEDLIRAQSMGYNTMLFCKLAPDPLLLADAQTYLKTDVYMRQNNSSTTSDSIRRILAEKATQNTERRRQLIRMLNRLLAESKIWLNGSLLELGASGEGRNRINAAAQELIKVAYPNLRMLRDVIYSEETIRTTIRHRVDDLFKNDDATLSEAEQDMLALLKRRKSAAERTTVSDLRDYFGRKPYGWYPMAVFTLIARLYKRGKLEGRLEGNLLADNGMLDALTNNRNFDKTLLEPQEDFDLKNVRKLRELYAGLFDETSPNDPKELAVAFQKKAAEMAKELTTLRNNAGQYGFLSALNPVIDQLSRLAQKEYAFLINQTAAFGDDLLDAKEDLIAPVRQFMNGPQKTIFDRLREFIKGDQSNFSYVDASDLDRLKSIYTHNKPFTGVVMQEAKKLMDQVGEKVAAEIARQKQQASDTIRRCIDRLQQQEEFGKLLPDQQRVILKPLNALLDEIAGQRYIDSIQLMAQRAETQTYTEQLNRVVKLVQQAAEKTASPAVSTAGGPITPGSEGHTPAIPKAAEPTIMYVPRQSIRVAFSKHELKTEDDVDAYVEAMRAELKALINANKRISL